MHPRYPAGHLLWQILFELPVQYMAARPDQKLDSNYYCWLAILLDVFLLSRTKNWVRESYIFQRIFCNRRRQFFYPFTTAGRITDTSFDFFCIHTTLLMIVLIALKISEGFFHGLIFMGEKTELIYLYYVSIYTCSCTLVTIFKKSPK